MRKITRSGASPENTFTEVIEGDTPCTFETNTNAKGKAQLSIKIIFTDADAMEQQIETRLRNVIQKAKGVLASEGIPLASESDK